MARAGFAGGRGRTETVDVTLAGGVARAAQLATNLGPAARILREKGGTAEDAAAIAEAVAAGLAPYADARACGCPRR